jgi:hypothetical protein
MNLGARPAALPIAPLAKLKATKGLFHHREAI